MDSVLTLQNHRRILRLPVNRFPSPSKPPSSLSFRSQLPISPPPSSTGNPRRRPKPSFSKIPHPISLSILKTTSLTFAAAAALFLIRISGQPAVAAPIPLPTVESTKESKCSKDDDNDIEAFGPLMVVRSKFPESLNNLERFMELDPDQLQLVVLGAYIVGDPESARMEFERILAKDPFEFRAYQGLLMVTESSDTDSLKAIMNRAERALENRKKLEGKLVVRRFKLLVAWIKVMTGSYSEALSDYQELEREEPMDFWPYLCQGIVYALLGKFDEVGKSFQMFERLFPHQPDKSYFRRGR